MEIPYVKMHGIGNDYIVVDNRRHSLPPADPGRLSKAVCNRRRGIGADGLLWIDAPSRPHTVADLRIFNADGSEAANCGNALRCAAKYFFDREYAEEKLVTVTMHGFLHSLMQLKQKYAVTMGRTVLPSPKDKAYSVMTENGYYEYIPIIVGNPHSVTFVETAKDFPLSELAKAIRGTDTFPEGVNVEIAEVLHRNCIAMRVDERGCGETVACGSGASAVTAAAVRLGLADTGRPIRVRCLGGDLFCVCDEQYGIRLIGEAAEVASGIYKYTPVTAAK